jgi:acyl-coenzyme A thioesterase PaaI-like protein
MKLGMKLGIATLTLSGALFAMSSVPAGADDLGEDQGWGAHGNISQAAADAAGSYAAAGVLQAQQNFNVAEWSSLPAPYLTSNVQTLFSRPGPARFYTEEQLEQLRMLAAQRGIALPVATAVAESGPPSS